MQFRKIFQFSTLSKQLIQDTERYYYLNQQSTRNQMFFEQFQQHKQNYFNTLLTCDLKQISNWRMLIQNLFRIETEPNDLMKQIIKRYSELYGIEDLLKINNYKLTQLLINHHNIYDVPINLLKCDGIAQIIEQYELSLTVYRDIQLNKLFKHLILCQKLNLQVIPIHTFNLVHYNIEQSQELEFLNDLVLYQRSKRSQTNKLPNETWSLVFNRILSSRLDESRLLYTCQLLQQFAHQKINIKFDLMNLLKHVVDEFRMLPKRQATLLEIIRTINILKANKYDIAELKELRKICAKEPQLQGDKEYDLYMNLEHQTQSIELIDNQNLNAYLTEILLGDVQKLGEIQKTDLREKILNKLQTETDENSLKKIIVVSRQLWPTEISIVQRCAKQIRNLLANNDQTKEMISLAINSLYEFKRIQYPFLDDQLINYLASVDDLYISPQEISVLLYYICLSLPKLTKKELTRVNQREYPINENLSKILINLLPVIKKMCSKNALRLKVIYTLTDCICKYKEQLVDVDLKFLFEKIEFNLVKELELKQQCRVAVEQKDIQFLHERFRYLKVGSRKLLRFFDDAKSNYFGALQKLLQRQRVYLRMRQSRGKSIRAQRSF
ncbi:unnamed protein product [Paramecium octaurelia]|uniref:Uncharacterized protein n=1 Tax=Paramecium octaurelia TaxID=43137 RepID=A0A8S1UEZ5_PAROT|nr:unnamed protein product [Paramecium octaurelia]